MRYAWVVYKQSRFHSNWTGRIFKSCDDAIMHSVPQDAEKCFVGPTTAVYEYDGIKYIAERLVIE
jgi:hypothetical protein